MVDELAEGLFQGGECPREPAASRFDPFCRPRAIVLLRVCLFRLQPLPADRKKNACFHARGAIKLQSSL